MTNIERHKQLTEQIHDTYIKKNNDYGNSFSLSYQKYGAIAGLVRMEDKWNRLNTLILGDKQMVKDESVIDTLLDLANYSLMLAMEFKDNTINDLGN